MLGGLLALVPLGAADAATKPVVTWKPAHPSNYVVASGRTIDRIIVHKAEGSSYATWNWFQNPVSRASTQYVVDHDGSIIQMVADKDIAWHAGNDAYSRRSIGIENA